MKKTVAAIQMVSSSEITENLSAAAELIQQAVQQQASIVQLPENFAFMSKDDQAKIAIAEEINNGPIQQFCAEQAKAHGIYLIAGTIPIKATNNPDKCTATSLVFDPNGECITRYNKIHLFDVIVSDTESHKESNAIEPGMVENAAIAECGDTTSIGLSVCYDLRFPELYRQYAKQGCNMLSIPAAFTQVTGQAHWEILLRARAIENLCFVISANQGGEHPWGRQTFGHSMIISPWGEILASCGYGPSVVVAECDLNWQDKKRGTFPALQHIRM